MATAFPIVFFIELFLYLAYVIYRLTRAQSPDTDQQRLDNPPLILDLRGGILWGGDPLNIMGLTNSELRMFRTKHKIME